MKNSYSKLSFCLKYCLCVERNCYFQLALEGSKLEADIGTPRTVKVTNQRPPSRRKNCPGPSSPHEYKVSSFKDEYSFTYTDQLCGKY